MDGKGIILHSHQHDLFTNTSANGLTQLAQYWYDKGAAVIIRQKSIEIKKRIFVIVHKITSQISKLITPTKNLPSGLVYFGIR